MYIICPAQSLIDYTHNSSNVSASCHQSIQQISQHSSTAVSERPLSHFKVASIQNSGQSSSGVVRKTSPGSAPGGGQSDRATGHESLRQMCHPSVWPTVKTHINTSLALVKNLTDLTQELSQMYEHHAEELQLLVANYRKKNAELRKDRQGVNCMMEVWESMLQGVEADSAAHSEVAAVLSRQVSRQTLERSFFRKLQARKLLQHRESLDTIVTKAEDNLAKCRQDYKVAYTGASLSPTSGSAQAAYLDCHNTYVTQLHATNAIVDTYAKETLPDILQELEDVYCDLCKTMSESLAIGAEILSNRTGAQSRRWCTLWSECKAVEPSRDTVSLVRTTNLPSQPHPSHRMRLFTPPQPVDPPDGKAMDGPGAPLLKNELIQDRLASLQPGQRYDELCEEANQLQMQIQQLQDTLSNMVRLQQRSLESQLFNKANEIQEDISKKRYELKTAQLNYAANRAQRELFAGKVDNADGGTAPPQDRKMSSASSISMKSKWLKAFKSLKTPPPNGSSKEAEKDKRENEGKAVTPSDSLHQFQEYTYKKITPCDVCSQVLRGHTRQGLKCRICKLNVHIDCQERVGKCQAKSRLLRRQKSSSEIETRVTPPQVTQPQTPHSNSDIEQGDVVADTRQLSPDIVLKHQKSPDIDKYFSETISPSEQAVRSRSVTFRTPPTDNESIDYGSGSQPRRRHNVFGVKKFMFGHRSHERASSLPETEESYGARERPFGQPLLLSSATTPIDPDTPSPQLPIVANSIHPDKLPKRHH